MHKQTNECATGQSTSTVTMPLTMFLYGQCVGTSIRMTTIDVRPFTFDTTAISSYTVGIINSSNSSQNIPLFVILIGCI